jgi:hypothetical protein
MEYRATFKSNFGLVVLALPVCGFTIAVGAMQNEFAMVILGVTPLAWLLAIRLRLRVALGNDYLQYTGLLSTRRIRLSEVTDCCPMANLGWPINRFYGPFTYRIRTPQESLKINFKFFPLECMHDVLERIEPAEYEY